MPHVGGPITIAIHREFQFGGAVILNLTCAGHTLELPRWCIDLAAPPSPPTP